MTNKGWNRMPILKCNTKRNVSCFSIVIMIATVFAPAIYAEFSRIEHNDKIYNNDVVHLDLSFSDDVTSTYDLISTTPTRVIRINKNLKNNNQIYSLSADSHSIALKSIQIMDDERNNSIININSRSKYISSIKDTEMKYLIDNSIEVSYISTLTGIKEIIKINEKPSNISGNLKIQTLIEVPNSNIIKGIYMNSTKENSIVISPNYRSKDIFSISPPIYFRNYGDIARNSLYDIDDLNYNYKVIGDKLYYNIIIPMDIFVPDMKYPFIIDPSITSFNGYSEYKGYSNGSISFNNGVNTIWYHNVGRTIYLESDLSISANEKLILNNVIMKVNKTNSKIDVSYGGSLSIISNSTITNTDNCNNYSLMFENGSIGNVLDSIIENVNDQKGIEICSSSVTIDNCIIRKNQNQGIYVNRSSPTIMNCNIYCTNYGINISSFSNPSIIGNKINNTIIGITWENIDVKDNFSNTEHIEKLVGVNYDNATIYYNETLNNIALNCPSVTVDSEWYSGDYPKEKMNDGIKNNNYNMWSSDWTSEPHYAIFDFQEMQNISKFVIYHRSNNPTYDFQIQKWINGQWSNLFSVNDNNNSITYHNLSTFENTEKIRLYVTDSNEALDSVTRILEFEIYENSNNYDHYLLTKPIHTYGDTIFEKLYVDKTTVGNSEVLISILDGDTNTTISGFNRIDNDVIDLKSINIYEHNSIKLKFDFIGDGTNIPSLSMWKLILSPLKGEWMDLSSESDIISKNNTKIISGNLQLSDHPIIEEQWEGNWNNSWVFTEKYDGGSCETVSNHWDGSGNDIYLQGISEIPLSGHDGWVSFNRYFDNISVYSRIKTHFKGKIDGLQYNYADNIIILHDESNSSFKRIWWTTRDYSYDTGLSGDGNTYYIVSQDDPTNPYEYDVSIDSTIIKLFEQYFGEGAINFSIYHFLEFKSLVIENYNQRQNPKVYIDYFIISGNYSSSGEAITASFFKGSDTSWVYVLLDAEVFSTSDIKLSLLKSNDLSYINGYQNIYDTKIDLSTLNNKGINNFKIRIEINKYLDRTPVINRIVVLTTSNFEANNISDNEVGMKLNESAPLLQNNIFNGNTRVGLKIMSKESSIESNSFYVNQNRFIDNAVGMKIVNSSVNINTISFLNNNNSFEIDSSTLDAMKCEINGANDCPIITNSNVTISKLTTYSKDFEMNISNSYVRLDTYSYNNRSILNINNSNIQLVDVYYTNITLNLDNESVVVCKWKVNLELVDNDNNEKEDVFVTFHDCNGGVIGTGFDTGNNGLVVDYEIEERKITKNYEKTFNPINITFNDNPVPLFVNIIHPFSQKIKLFGDFDGDGIMNADEDANHTYYFSGLDLSSHNSQNSDYGITIGNTGTNIVNKYVIDLKESYYKFYMMVRSVVDPTNNVTLKIYNKTATIYTFHLTIDQEYRLYSTPIIFIDDSIIGINVSSSDDIENGAVLLKYMIIKDIIRSPNKELLNPINADFDGDEIIDGNEHTQNIILQETEEIILDSSQLYKDPTASNGTSVLGLSNNTVVIKRFRELNGNYSVFLKGKYYSEAARNVTVSIDGEMTTIELKDHWDWYFIKNITSSNPLIRIAKQAGSNITIDKLCLFRNYYGGSDNKYYSEMEDVDNIITKSKQVVLNNKWNVLLKEKIVSNPSATYDRLYYSTLEGNIVVQSRINGTILMSKNIISRNKISYASMPIIEGNVGICYFEVESGWGNHSIVGFNLNTLNRIFIVNYSNSKTIRNSGIISFLGRFFYTISDGQSSSYIFCRNAQDGSELWNFSIGDSYLTRPTIDTSLLELYFGSNGGYLYVVQNILNFPQLNSRQLSPNIDVRSPLLLLETNWLYTISYNGELIKIDTSNGEVTIIDNELPNGYYENIRMTYDDPYLLFILDGDLWKINIDKIEEKSYNNNELIDGTQVRISENKIIVIKNSELIFFDYSTLDQLDIIYFNNNLTDITIVDEYMFLSEKETGFIRGYGPMISDISDLDFDSDQGLDGREKYSYHRIKLIEAEDYHTQVSTQYNISAVTMFVSENPSNTDVGYSLAQKEAKMNYSLKIEKDGWYSIVIRSTPEVWFDSSYDEYGCGNMDYFRDHTLEYILKAMDKIFNIEFIPTGEENYLLIQKGNWDLENALGGVEYTAEKGSADVGYIFEAKYFFEKGNYDFIIDTDVWDDSNNKPYSVILNGNLIYVVGAKIPIDNIFFRYKGLSIIDPDCDNDGLEDSFEMDNKLFPLNSDADMDGLSDYYEVNGINRNYSFEYDGTNPWSRDTDLDGIRDRIELGLDNTTNDPYTIFDTNPSLASIYERHVRSIDLHTGTIYNIDSDTSSCSDPTDWDTDGDGLPDGVRDGLYFEPLFLREGEYGPKGRDRWYYSPDLLNFKFEFWEGEDFDVDGEVDQGQWNPNYYTHEPGGGETDPNNPDCDGDLLPDGWEVWYNLDPCNGEGINGGYGDADYSGADRSTDTPLEFLELSQLSRVGDGLNNYEEYRFGLNPNVRDTDGEGKNDTEETYIISFGNQDYQEFINTTIKDACLSGYYYGLNKTNEYLSWLGHWYEYEKTIKLDGYEYKLNYPKNLTNSTAINEHLTYLYDGSEIIYNTSFDEVYVLKSLSILDDNDGDGYIDLECVVYDRIYTEPQEYPIYRYQIIFISDPMKPDTENDGLTDYEEDWSTYSAEYNYFGDKDHDDFPNLRDHDSDNDRLLDGQEYRYYYEYFDQYNKTKTVFDNNTDYLLYNDHTPCVLDRDSDNDNIEDGDEHIRNGVFLGFMDIDGDGYPAMLDIDSDGDGIPDGLIDGYIYNPNLTIYQGGFFDPDVESYMDGKITPSEGEDLDLDGLIKGDTNGNRMIDDNETFLETDPYHPDTDRDMLCDGYSPSWIPTIRQNIWGDNILPIGEWNNSCNNTMNDTDGDKVNDGLEVLGFDITITDLDGFTEVYHFTSDPTDQDTDNDGWDDFEEYMKYDPRSSDTDKDNKTDSSEVQAGTDPYDQDTDNDYLPDLEIDINRNGYVESNERDYHPTEADYDGDGIPDGVEMKYLLFRTNAENGKYYQNGTWIYMDPGIGRRMVFWYSGNVSSNNITNNQKMNFTDPNNYEIYSNISNASGPVKKYNRFSSSYCNFVLIKYNSTISYKFLEHDTYFDQLHWTGSMDEFNDIYKPPFKSPARSLHYCQSEKHLSISSPYNADTDGDGLDDYEELYNLTNNNIMLLLHDFDGDGINPLRDSDSDGDGIEDDDDLWRNTEDNSAVHTAQNDDDWIRSYSEDFDGDGLPNALDGDSDNDGTLDGSEDSNQNGYYETGETNPLSQDDDYDGIFNDIEVYFIIKPNDNDTDNDGIIDGQDGPGNKWWMDIDGDGLICAADSDSDGDGINDGAELEMGTSPWNPDSDGDGLWDGENITCNTVVFKEKYYFVKGRKFIEYENVSGQSVKIFGEKSIGTDPLNDDTDGDGLLDGEEYYGYAECGILLNKFDQKKKFGHGSKYLDIPIPAPGNYTLAAFYTPYIDSYLDIELYDCTDDSYENGVSATRLKSGNSAHFFNIGHMDNYTTYMLKISSYFRKSDANYFLLRQGLSPISNDTDSDYLSDYDEIFGKYGYHTHPLSSDSDGDGLSDWKELYYSSYDNSEEVIYQLNPLNPDIDQDDVPDGCDLEPMLSYSMNWNNTLMPYVMNKTSWIEFIFPVRHTDGAYSASGVSHGELSREALESSCNDQLGDQYIFTAFHENTEASKLDTYTYWPYGGWNNPATRIEYEIKTQRINATYTNKVPIRDEAIHTQFESSFKPGSDYQISFLISVDGKLFDNDNPYENASIISEYRIFDDYSINNYSKGKSIYFNSFSLYDNQSDCKLMKKEYDYYGGNRIYKVSLLVPKEIIEKAYNGRYIDSKKLAFDMSLRLNVLNGTNFVESRSLLNKITIGSFLKKEYIYTYSMITKPDISPYYIEYMIDESGIDLSTSRTSSFPTEKGNVKIINYILDNEKTNKKILENVAKGKNDYIAVIMIASTQYQLDNILQSTDWSLCWSFESNDSCKYRPYENIIGNEKTQVATFPEYWDGKLDKNIYQEVGEVIDKSLDAFSDTKVFNSLNTEYKARIIVNNQILTYSSKTGFSSLTLSSSYMEVTNTKGGLERTQMKETISVSYCDIDELGNSFEYYGKDTKIIFNENKGMKHFLKKIDYISNSFSVAYDIYTIYCDADNIIELMKNSSTNKLALSVMILQKTIDDGYSLYKDTKKLYKTIKGIESVPKFPIVDIIIDTVVLILEITVFAILYQDAPTWIHAHMYVFNMVDAVFSYGMDVLLALLVFTAPPIGTIIALGWAIFMLVLSLTGKDDDVKKGIANILGFVTAEDELAAFQGVTDRINEWVATYTWWPETREDNVIYLGLYPDISR